MKKNLYLNDVNVGNYGIFINSDTYLNAPQIDYNDYKVPARNGSVIQYNKRFENVVRKFECYIPETQNVQTALDSLKKLIYSNVGYLKISSDYEPDYYMYGYLAQEIEVKPFNQELSATFELYFSCMPQKISIEQNNYIFTRSTQDDILILNENNSELVRSALDELPYYAEKYSTYALCTITQLGLDGTVKLSTSYKGSIFLICTFDGTEPTYVDYLTYYGGLNISANIEVPSEYNTSEYYACMLVPTAKYYYILAIARYGSSQTLTKNFTLGRTVPNSLVGALGEIQLLVQNANFTEVRISNGQFGDGDGVIALNDMYVEIDWYQMYLDGYLDTIKQCVETIDGTQYCVFRINLSTFKSYLYYSITETYTSIDKYVTIYGAPDISDTNYLCISRKTDNSSLLYPEWFGVSANMQVNWWKV